MTRKLKARRAVRKLAASVTGQLSGPVPSRQLCEALCHSVSRMRRRPVNLMFVEFPASVTGLAIVHDDHDTILVDSRATGVQSVVITGHELGHLLEDGGPHHQMGGATAAARLLGGGDLESALRNVPAVLHASARAHAQDPCEEAAEAFGITLGGLLLPWVDDTTQEPGPTGELLGRLHTSLGPR
ncbi:hypothetical protein [Streptomyces sp. SS8]